MKLSTLRLYRKFRSNPPFMLVGYNAIQALEAAKLIEAWNRLESVGLVRLQAEADEDYQWNEYDPKESEKYGDDGAWGSVGEYRTSPDGEWETGDSVWGHVGYNDVLSPYENCYILDIMRQTVEDLKAALQSRCNHCRKCA